MFVTLAPWATEAKKELYQESKSRCQPALTQCRKAVAFSFSPPAFPALSLRDISLISFGLEARSASTTTPISWPFLKKTKEYSF